jgi:putative PIN family toxin of toxin-antitoxin system
MRVIVDTNVLLTSISDLSPTHLIFQKMLSGELEIGVTTDILLEYEDIFLRRTNPSITFYVMRILNELPNVNLITKYYFWLCIQNDFDDNKFVDCAVAFNADYIVTNDKHFNVLKNIAFPEVKVISPLDFLEILSQ